MTGLGYRLAEVILCGFLHFLQDHGRNLGRRVFATLNFYPCIAIVALDDFERDEILVLGNSRIIIPAANETLDREQRVQRVGHSLTFGRLTSKDARHRP